MSLSIANLIANSLTTQTATAANVTPYTVVETSGDFELRDYPIQKLVDCVDNDQTWDKLYGFITGDNEQN